MKIALVRSKTPCNNLYNTALENFKCLNDFGLNATVIIHNQLNDSYDGYIFISDHLDHPTKARALLDKKPTAWLSGALFPSLKQTHIRILWNGITPNFGTWAGSQGFSPPVGLPKKIGLITPNNFHTDIAFGKDVGTWIQEVILHQSQYFDKLLLKFHPKVKTNADVSRRAALIKRFQEQVDIIDNRKRDLSEIEYTHCINYTSTASVEAYLDGKAILPYSWGDFIANNPTKESLEACMWKPLDMSSAWKANSSIFESVTNGFWNTSFEQQVLQHLRRKA